MQGSSDAEKPEAKRRVSMKTALNRYPIAAMTVLCVCLSATASAQHFTQTPTTSSSKSQVLATESPSSTPQLIQPEELAKIVRSSKGDRPLILQVGFHVLYQQAHIPQAEYIDPASGAEGLRQLRQRVAALPHSQSIVLYCGCCPWSKCPNISPAYGELHAMGFTNVKVLFIADNFGKDWVDKGYPVAKGN
jgi:thiosulfate/3-mercaptopyruvate sulfurtransferase